MPPSCGDRVRWRSWGTGGPDGTLVSGRLYLQMAAFSCRRESPLRRQYAPMFHPPLVGRGLGVIPGQAAVWLRVLYEHANVVVFSAAESDAFERVG